MEPEIILHMKKLSLQDQNLKSFDNEIELNKKRYSEQFFNGNVNSTNELIIHLKRLSLESQSVINKNELYKPNKVQMIEKLDNLQSLENKDYQKDSTIIKGKNPQLIVKDIVEQNVPHAITMGHFMPQTFENKDLHNNNNGGSISSTSSRKRESVKSFEIQQFQNETKIHCQAQKISDGKKPMSKNQDDDKIDTFNNLTPKTWDSWTSSTLSSLPANSIKKNSKFQVNHNIPWKKLISKEKPEVENVTSLNRFVEVFEPRHGTRYGTQRKFCSKMIKNIQWPSNKFFTCLLCDKPGHFCHECKFYNQFIFQHNHLSSKTLLDVIKDIDYDIKNTIIVFHDKTNKPLKLINETSKLIPRTNQNQQIKTSLHSSSIYNEIEYINSKDYLSLAHIYKIKHKFGLACKKNIKTKKRVFTNCLLCGCLGHLTNKCQIGPYCRYVSKINSRSCRYNIHQLAQLSFRIDKKEPSPTEKLDQCYPYLCYQATTKMYQIKNIDTTKSLQMKRINVHDSMYKVCEVDYDKFLTSKNKQNNLIMNILKYKDAVSVVIGKVNGREITMLLDTGSTITSIAEDLVEQMNLKPWYTNHVLTITLANTQTEEYSERLCIVRLEVGDVECCETLTVLPGQLYDITLGRNWLKAHMAICDHGLDILRIPGSRPIKMGLVPFFDSKSSLQPIF